LFEREYSTEVHLSKSQRRHLYYSCPIFAGDSGAALVIKDGCLVGMHLETINALCEQIDRKKLIKDHFSNVEESLENILAAVLAQGCSALLAQQNSFMQ
jgi:hypothetical protein